MFLKKLKEAKALEATHIDCPNCREETLIDDWHTIVKNTYGNDSPDVRIAHLDKKNSFPYQCPSCFMAFSAYQLTLTTNDTSVQTREKMTQA
ncbi:hypothetical protein [Alteribacter aurantiacus]|uniref:hypothetical protein n=1 Tax=Alteribacter aurantiacus TaxID=254410 RepID=UPI00040864B2|nr:hypothetical protein [Alteribacter aurantiacus]